MVDVDTFLTTLSVMIDDCCQASLPADAPPGPQAALSRSAGLTLASCGPWQEFGSARGFERDAQRHWRAAFPSLPARTQFNRQRRHHPPALVLGVLPLVQLLAAHQWPMEWHDSNRKVRRVDHWPLVLHGLAFGTIPGRGACAWGDD
jgi:hypothetical protein